MSEDQKSCKNCGHRDWDRCTRVGWICSTEMKFGGLCASGLDLRLWTPRETLLQRVRKYFRKCEARS